MYCSRKYPCSPSREGCLMWTPHPSGNSCLILCFSLKLMFPARPPLLQNFQWLSIRCMGILLNQTIAKIVLFYIIFIFNFFLEIGWNNTLISLCLCDRFWKKVKITWEKPLLHTEKVVSYWSRNSNKMICLWNFYLAIFVAVEWCRGYVLNYWKSTVLQEIRVFINWYVLIYFERSISIVWSNKLLIAISRLQ